MVHCIGVGPKARIFRAFATHTPRASRRASLLRGLSPLVALALHAGTARADPFHAQTLPLGQHATGMGGAFVAVSDDPSATYYNPAGILWTSETSLSASLTLTAFDRSSVESGYRTSVGNSSLRHNTEPSLPVFVSAVKHLGRRDDEGRRRHGIAFSSFTVSQRRLDYDVEVERDDASGRGIETLSIENSDRTVWTGLSYAYLALRKLSVGFSGFLSIQRTRYFEERISVALADTKGDGTQASDRNSWTSHLVNTSVKSFVGRFGALYAFNEQLRLGMMFQPPSIHVRGSADVRERALRNDVAADPPSSSFLNASQSNLPSHSPMPWELRLGVRYAVYDWLMFAIDGSVYGATGSKQHPVVAVGKRTPDPQTGAIADVGTFTTDTWYRNYNGNVAVGMSTTLADSIAIRAGVYTDLSSAPSIPRTSISYQMPDINRVGGTLSIGIAAEGYDLSLGVVGLYGRGHALSFNADAEDTATYQRTRATDRMFFVFLNGVRNAVRKLAAEAGERLQPREPKSK